MGVQEFKNLTDDQLRQKADECLAVVDDPNYGPIHAAKLLQAQLYMNELNRRNDERIATRDGEMADRSHTLEVWVIVLIGIEIVLGLVSIGYGIKEGNKQADILNDMKTSTAATAATLQTQGTVMSTINDNTAKTVEAVKRLQEAQDNSLKTSNASLLANKQIADTLTNQLRILKVEQDARIEHQNRHPVLELTARTWEFGTGYRTVQLESGNSVGAAVLRVTRTKENQVEVRFYLRNVGNAPAINVTATPRTATSVYVQCVDFPFLMLATNDFSYKPCDQPFAVIPPIYPRPKDRTEVTSDFFGSKFDQSYDVAIDVIVTVPPNINSFDLELVIRAEQFVPLEYRVQCHTAT
jgi:hypothetical protein